MTEALVERRYTVADLEKLDDPGRFELIDGELVERDMGYQASVLVGNLLTDISVYVRRNGLGYVSGPDTTVDIFGGGNLPRPDIVFVSFSTLGDRTAFEGNLTVAPDLVVEVVSRHDNARNINLKVERYLEAGIKLVWVAWPDTQTVGVYRTDGTVLRLTRNATLSGEDVIPGFEIPLSQVFIF